MEILEERNHAMNGWHRRRMARIRDAAVPPPRDLPRKVRYERILVEDDHLRYRICYLLFLEVFLFEEFFNNFQV